MLSMKNTLRVTIVLLVLAAIGPKNVESKQVFDGGGLPPICVPGSGCLPG